MKSKITIAVVLTAVFICISLIPPISAEDKITSAKSKNASGKAVAAFPETKYTFEPVLEGAKVTHDFTVKNNGDATLDIKKVLTG